MPAQNLYNANLMDKQQTGCLTLITAIIVSLTCGLIITKCKQDAYNHATHASISFWDALWLDDKLRINNPSK